ncbi:outer membrane protein [Catalinimonas alkaloidigena]|uniref:TolC family protein n=1 Tax=Catalinimonas alkaloidigena TaxID=1075417 RepID=UPI002404D8F2|nr:TolC family protein [Catalinimonas alkaloidigena]MDF9799368.1 outer membrane protein [Catalinimonas alkaloidigena]
MNSTILKLLICFCLFVSLQTQAQAPTADKRSLSLSLDDCIAHALKQNLNLRHQRLNISSEKVALKHAYMDLLPTVNANTGMSYSVGRTINQFTNEYVDRPVRQQNMSISAEVALFDGFKKINTVRKNKLYLRISQYDLQAVEQEITLEVIQAYMQVLFAQEIVALKETQWQATQSQLNSARKLVRAGSLVPTDETQLEAQLFQDQQSVIETKRELAISQLHLKQILQLPANQSIAIEAPEKVIPDKAETLFSTAEVYLSALEQQAAILSADMLLRSAQYDISISKAGFFPYLSLRAGLYSQYSSIAPEQIPVAGIANVSRIIPTGSFVLSPADLPGLTEGTKIPVYTETEIPAKYTDNNYINQLDFNLRRYISINLSIPIFNNTLTKTRTSYASIRLDQARLNAMQLRQEVRQAIELAYLKTKAAADSHAAAQRRVGSLTEVYTKAKTSFRAGRISALDLIQTKRLLEQATSDLTRVKYEYFFGIKLLKFYRSGTLGFE